MIIGVYGQGCVGAITAACLAENGRDVTAVDSDEAKVDCLRRGIAPVQEPGLADIVRASLAELIEFAQTLVLCHDDAVYLAELRRAVRPSQCLVDLAGVGSAASSAAQYCGAAW